MSLPLTALGAVLVALGGLWTLQGFGVVGGSFMSGDALWAVIGSITALAGLVLIARGRT